MFSLKGSVTAVAGLYVFCTVVVCPLMAPCRGGQEYDYEAAKPDAADTSADAAVTTEDAGDAAPGGDTRGADTSPQDRDGDGG